MAQVTLQIDEETMKRVQAAAKSAGMSMSAWLAQLVRERTRAEWPTDAVALAGAWRDVPHAETLRASQPGDVQRVQL